MKSYIVALLPIAGAAVAQRKTWLEWGLPECSVECLDTAIASATKCSAGDWDCFCIADNYRNTYDAAVGCVLAKCGQDVSIGTYQMFLPLHRYSELRIEPANSRIPGKVLPAAAALCEVIVGPYTETWTDGQPPATPAPTGASATGPAAGTTATAPAAAGTSPASSSPSSGAVQLSVGLGAAVPLVLAAIL